MFGAFKRLSTTIAANFNWAVTQIENHDALVASAIREVQRGEARARVQLTRVKRDGESLRAKINMARASAKSWEERAQVVAATDQKKAIECMKRRKRFLQEINERELQLAEQDRMEQELVRDIEAVQGRLEELKRKRNLMKGRESTAYSLSTLQSQEVGILGELDDVFERWEVKISEYETSAAKSESGIDELEAEFLSQEEEQELAGELAKLVSA